ncbi:MAG: hypothetical protein K1X53_17605 [Candidatus Sumerlaeaceae bacterium]|nr:hypothetical protein [Candidatus Sumerlaeaceae bacterium]
MLARIDKDIYLKIGRPQNVCVVCGAEIVEAGKHLSAIAADTAAEEDATIREDYCAECWEKRQDKNYIGFWLARREKPVPRKIQNRKERNAALLALFDYLQQNGQPEHAAHLHFLAHLLMKYKIFAWVRTEPVPDQPGRERVVFRNTVTDDHLTVESVQVTDEEAAAIQKDVDEHLSRWQPDTETAAPADEVESEKES